jgi:hypothetical protein
MFEGYSAVIAKETLVKEAASSRKGNEWEFVADEMD